MGRDLQKRKRRSSRPAIRQPSSTKSKLTNPLGNSIVARNWNKKETTTQNYRRLGLVSRLRAPTGGAEPDKKRIASSKHIATAAASKRSKAGDPFAISGAINGGVSEVQVERDESGQVVRVVSAQKKPFNPLNDPLVDLDSDSDAASSNGENAEEWGGFAGEDDQNDIIRQLENEANRPVEKKPRTQSSREVEWLQRLVDRHGEDTAAMARDRKLNPMQQTAADIAKRIRKWKGGAAS
ncbi:ribosome biogenesis protein Nop16 [Xylariaceae sp. FL1651]|nr:ribosome biogenesis protein Nop16 [Xylariaceae sp. FL1651]